ncbi:MULTISPECIES: hypothetical protein [Oceanotoga]|jgi:putative GTP pyrophosphokinase|uniref:hypothetical protein n=1 Tax=Oceanotoga TaxID=1255275 RepID=UPI00265079CF|nr:MULTISPECIES: hypothetical protein [Oceanotoga]MDN5343888.1 hypothetical protein [Oceanotoga sp.]MDO7975831.1 hypothetical protein [Oceanotoga teriensis]
MGEEDKFYKVNKVLSNLIENIQKHNIFDDNFSSLRKTIENFEVKEIFDNMLSFYEIINDYDINSIIEDFDSDEMNLSYRLKSLESFKIKWNKNIGKSKQLREVSNDSLAFRFIVDIEKERVLEIIEKVYKYNKGFEVVDFYKDHKSKDDGYRGIHLYFRLNPKTFPIEIQFWNRKDAILNYYTHEIIYKSYNKEDYDEYSYKLRKWLDKLPEAPKNIDKEFIDFWYEMFLEVDNRGD